MDNLDNLFERVKQYILNHHDHQVYNTNDYPDEPNDNLESNEYRVINMLGFERAKERYYCPCPKCGGFQSFKFLSNLRYETVDNQDKELVKDSVYYECEFCQYKIKEVYKSEMLKKGEWRADKPDADFPSYRLNALYSPFITWDDCVKKYLLAKKDKSEMKTFVNTYLGEIYEEEQSKLDSTILYSRTKKENK